MGEGKKLCDDDIDRIRKEILADLVAYDLVEWQTACRGFGPIHNNQETRKQWFAKNEYRLSAAREIVDFVTAWIEQIKNEFPGEYLKDIRVLIVDTIRLAQVSKGMEKGLLNKVKLSGFRTLIKWADNPRELKKKREYVPRSKDTGDSKQITERKNALGEYVSPRVELDRDYQILSDGSILLTVVIWNDFLHPYQNVELELSIDSRLKVKETKHHKWTPKRNIVQIGFLEASMDNNPREEIVEISVSILESADDYSIRGKIIYDDCEKGVVAEVDLEEVTISL